jgi:hypothetical protein
MNKHRITSALAHAAIPYLIPVAWHCMGVKTLDLFEFLHLNKENDKVQEILNKLIRYVPYRFIRPWYEETIGIKDGIVHEHILLLQNSGKYLPPYFIDVNNKEININSLWFDWLFFYRKYFAGSIKFNDSVVLGIIYSVGEDR